jgi:hypothetical protein
MSLAVLSPARTALAVDYGLSVGPDFHTIIRQWQEAVEHYQLPATRQPPSLEQIFHELVMTWRKETRFTSSVTDMAMHRSYQRIIGLGPAAIPLLLRELERQPDHWFWALHAITGVDPTTPAQKGKVQEMAKAWLDWGRGAGYNW